MPAPHPSNLLTRSEFARENRICLRTVDNLRRRGLVKWFRVGRQIRMLPLDPEKEADKKAK